MTTRKRLTDMVREEVQKSAGAEVLTIDLAETTEIKLETKDEVGKKQAELGELIPSPKNNQEFEPQENMTGDQKQEIATLNHQLAQAEAKITSLTTELNQTQSYLAQASQVKTDLDAATAENLVLKAEIVELQEQNSQLAKTQTKAPLARADQEKLRISQLLHRPIGSNAEQNRINNQNIGWFD